MAVAALLIINMKMGFILVEHNGKHAIEKVTPYSFSWWHSEAFILQMWGNLYLEADSLSMCFVLL